MVTTFRYNNCNVNNIYTAQNNKQHLYTTITVNKNLGTIKIATCGSFVTSKHTEKREKLEQVEKTISFHKTF
jgi:hypothetical protein